MQNITDEEFELISLYVKREFGINLTQEKKILVFSRLKNILIKNGLDSFQKYYNYLINDKTGKAKAEFIDKITTNHTFFMREADHFEFFKKNVLPKIEKQSYNKDIRIWCAGCSSGEESYTIQMILTDYFKNKANWNTDILATDISSDVLKKAIAGIYSKDKTNVLPEDWQKDYFKQISKNEMQVISEIKEKIIYKRFNLMEEKYPFKKKFQVIFCRNVMIYFDYATRERLIQKFYEASEKGTYLFIGHSETLNNINTGYEYVMPAVYIKR